MTRTIRPTEDQQYYELTSPTALPKASGFLWNDQMMIHMNCRGYAVAQFMQPEPAKYSHAPNLEAKTFMQPEQPYYAHHPGRFLFIKDEKDGHIFSAPYEPTRELPETYIFAAGKHDIVWTIIHRGLRIELRLTLPRDGAAELWRIKVKNEGEETRKLSLYPYFSVGYMSWMNQSGEYVEELGAVVCSSITPYQKVQDYPAIQKLRDKTYLLAETKPLAWEVSQEAFEGEGGIMRPSALESETLACGDSRYEMPAAAMQYRGEWAPGEEREYRFVFGPAKDEEEVAAIRERYFGGNKNAAGAEPANGAFGNPDLFSAKENGGGGEREGDPAAFSEDGFDAAARDYADYIAAGRGCLDIRTPDADLDNFVNHWLPRQVYYHGVTNRLSTDPQTRNYLQDHMGMSYIDSRSTRNAFLTSLSQQREDGSMPDGIVLYEGAELKYINQVPHTDHCVWLPVCLLTYLDETNDYGLLDEEVPYAGGNKTASVFEHIDRAVQWLIGDRDERGLNYINQGDWCDPMNMVGYKGRGVSGWLTIATAYSCRVWADICERGGRADEAAEYREQAEEINGAVNRHLWDGDWYARGITDDGIAFGIRSDEEGRIFINPQGWSLLSGAADESKKAKLIRAVEEQLESPYGVEKLAPSYTAMREDVGRVTQKHPGSAENGAVYNHAAAFYIYALYAVGEKENAYRLLRKMLPGTDEADIAQRGQLPVFIPNYYRGAYRQFPRTAGRSSHLFNTGTVPWVYRCVIDGLFGVQGTPDGLRVAPQLPADWSEASAVRRFRGAEYRIAITREAGVSEAEVYAGGERLDGGIVRHAQPGGVYEVKVKLPL
ncbi:NdvB protein [Saccharibacillus sp. CPCC 101409]|uniref:GH36-type glycosyl hydrolase domain-containing protein n=1 Tax=Saccharibacillus sp. CPCC 101409 TaxID=3058041 RepID=UPI002672EB9D|nr:amylo-alpha-1,6-glucosidase [Saccharibacillus sp. CPCC 101409]MDO3409830.1 NdvB protein [Saccharibacillus sp. CPCC 101409]